MYLEVQYYMSGALAVACILLYPKTLGGGVIFSGSMPLNPSIKEQVSPEATKALFFCLFKFKFSFSLNT
jgi:predicted esterase